MQVIPGAGHFLAQEKPEEIAAVMNRWFAPSEGIAQAH
jgi:pimeloyl-ACP methyl ester carboxylesterase